MLPFLLHHQQKMSFFSPLDLKQQPLSKRSLGKAVVSVFSISFKKSSHSETKLQIKRGNQNCFSFMEWYEPIVLVLLYL